MLNIFNLFLFLLALWILFMVAGGNISWFYIFFGLGCAAFVSVLSFRFKLIEEKSELLYLSLGFYRHFVKIFFKGFFPSLKLIAKMALDKEPAKSLTYVVEIDAKNNFNSALLIGSLNMSPGLFCIGAKENQVLVHAINQEHFQKFNLQKNFKSLNNVNDDNLV